MVKTFCRLENDHLLGCCSVSLEVTDASEVLAASEMLVNFYQTTWPNNPEDSHFHTFRCKNLKSHFLLPCLSHWERNIAVLARTVVWRWIACQQVQAALVLLLF
jgi:hypothetical protein